MFSIIIPLYNKGPYILNAVNSVLGQSYSNFELIIVNDGSTDDSLEKIGSYSDHRIKIINQNNSGVSWARNNGVKEATKDYICFLDADDWWDINYLSEMKKLIKDYPEAGLYGCKYSLVKYGIKKYATIGLDSDFQHGFINYFKVYSKTMCMPLTSSSVIIPKKIFEESEGFKPELKLGEDFDLWLRIAVKYKVAFLNKPLSFYRQDSNELYKAVNSKKLYDKLEHYIFHLDYLKEYEKSNPDLKYLLDKTRVESLYRYYISKMYVGETAQIIKKVDFSKQPTLIRLKYNLPPGVNKFWFNSRIWLSGIKQFILKSFYFLRNIKYVY